ncbi:protein Wnt-4 [Condylostylus longicornis]|uniref:protein Wnt-4 n=1 Tax=Condylostylus longicornis TaxID=2530218 RepID=UPI00244DB462|nr:protein Wnt-4 [Condylostylus longicornis]
MYLWMFYIASITLSSIVCDDVTNGEQYISKHTVMAVFSPMIRSPGPCKYFPATRKQKHQCGKDYFLAEAIKEARTLAVTHCEQQFAYDRWNCSIETRGKRNIFKKLYRETAFVHALTAAAMTYSISRACAEGRMLRCKCGGDSLRAPMNSVQNNFRYGGCNDNIKHGKRATRAFLELKKSDGDEVSELLRHDSEVGIEVVASTMKEKCKCHGVSGSCSMKTCWKKLSDFNTTAVILRQKYHEAIRKPPSNRASRREAPLIKRPKRKKENEYSTLYYMETSPTFCAVTRGRRCLHPENCSTLCCGRGYETMVVKQIEKCKCRFKDGRCCQVICDYCLRYEDRYFCK